VLQLSYVSPPHKEDVIYIERGRVGRAQYQKLRFEIVSQPDSAIQYYNKDVQLRTCAIAEGMGFLTVIARSRLSNHLP
jgi:hypothetical protein